MKKMIWAIVRSDKVELIARQLKDAGVSGCTIYPVRGYGEQWHLYDPLIHGGHHKLEAIVDDIQVENVVKEVGKYASSREGDGILSVFDVNDVVLLRITKEHQ